ncbi:MAG: TetR/AcrR family transcriptional regulator, partial [Pseudolabrys sp.]|nr:TetR/AcrR family transcriptional regulator [Pseudolabrys sp.]
MILDEAVAFFAEHGFEAQVRELSERLGVSQGLIFRYFGTKQNLLEQVYQRVYVTRWSNDWDVLLRDRSRPLHDRLIDFYRAYLTAVDQYEWIRVSLYSGLAGYDLTRRYVMTRVELLLEVIIDELRRLAPAETLPERADALHEVVWHLHSTFVYYLVRKYVFRIPTL